MKFSFKPAIVSTARKVPQRIVCAARGRGEGDKASEGEKEEGGRRAMQTSRASPGSIFPSISRPLSLLGGMNELFADPMLEEMIGGPFLKQPHMLAVDIEEDPREYAITVDCPGVKKDQISLRLSDHILHISVEKHEEKKEGGEGKTIRSERMWGRVSRSIALPRSTVDPNRVEAVLKDGVLKVKIGKTEEAPGAKEISISTDA